MKYLLGILFAFTIGISYLLDKTFDLADHAIKHEYKAGCYMAQIKLKIYKKGICEGTK